MTITEALRKARGDVSLYRSGDGWVTTVRDYDTGMWWLDSNSGDYWKKHAEARRCRIRHALQYLGWTAEHADFASVSSDEEKGSAEDIVRRLVAKAPKKG